MSYCPWCHSDIVTREVDGTLEEPAENGKVRSRSFAAHVQTCAGAPDSIKADYLSPYP